VVRAKEDGVSISAGGVGVEEDLRCPVRRKQRGGQVGNLPHWHVNNT